MNLGLGDKVRSINPDGQVKAVGKVVTLFDPEYFVEHAIQKKYNPDLIWKKKYPDWKTKPIIGVWFETPQKTATLEEWVETGMSKGYSKEFCEKNYKLGPVTHHLTFPLDDLEVV